jgi:hypothetical protein
MVSHERRDLYDILCSYLIEIRKLNSLKRRNQDAIYYYVFELALRFFFLLSDLQDP